MNRNWCVLKFPNIDDTCHIVHVVHHSNAGEKCRDIDQKVHGIYISIHCCLCSDIERCQCYVSVMTCRNILWTWHFSFVRGWWWFYQLFMIKTYWNHMSYFYYSSQFSHFLMMKSIISISLLVKSVFSCWLNPFFDPVKLCWSAPKNAAPLPYGKMYPAL